MKYKITVIRIIPREKRKGTFKSKRKPIFAICPYEKKNVAPTINNTYPTNSLFEVSLLPEARKASLFKRFKIRLYRFDAWLSTRILSVAAAIRKIMRKLFGVASERQGHTAFFFGTLCSAVTVCILSASVIFVGLLGSYLAPFKTITVPSLVGKNYTDIESAIGDKYRLAVIFENSESIKAGTVISQSPSAGVTRKLYGKDSYCTLSVTVSSGRHFYTVEQLFGKSQRDALLILKNLGIRTQISEEYSDTIPAEHVISTSPQAGEKLFDGDILTLNISLGKRIPNVSVPDLYGLGEAQARAALETKGLTIGSITYKTSSLAAGKVFEQQYSPYSRIKKGSSVDISVSVGKEYLQKTVPDLYGLTAEQVAERLTAYGLVLGDTYTVSSGAPAGTVVAQTPIAGTPITSSIIFVDIYISS